MSKPRKKPPTPKRRSKRRRPPSRRITAVKILTGTGLLLGLVLGAGWLVHHFFPPPQPTMPELVQTPPPAIQETKPNTEASRPAATPKHPQPIYEIYPKSPDALQPQAKTAPPPEMRPSGRPKVAIIIDDIGYDRGLARQYLALNVPLTFSVLPESPFRRSILKSIRSKGQEIMLHQPMEPEEYPHVDPGPAALLNSMSADALIHQLTQNLDALPGVKGVNNHMGSRLTTESTRMYQVFSVLKKRGLYFIDSRSTAATVCRPSARMFQIPFGERDIFLDHYQEDGFIRGQFKQLIREAQKNGAAIAIAHPHQITVDVLREILPQLQQQVDLVPASEVVQAES
jgi:polysaccharide deacetylase 2 family uncharacterized protein YibQ